MNIFKWIRLEAERCPASVVRSRLIERVKAEKSEEGEVSPTPTDIICRVIMFWAGKVLMDKPSYRMQDCQVLGK